jgi:hypothetical protein
MLGFQTLQDGWLSCYSSSLGSNPDISQKYKMGVISKRNGQHILARQKNIYKKIYYEEWIAAMGGEGGA